MVRAGLGHAVAALRNDSVAKQLSHDLLRGGSPGNAKALDVAEAREAALAQLIEKVDRMGRDAEQKRRAGLDEAVEKRRALRQIMHDKLAANGQGCNEGA